jgi:hypothetical protein
MTRTQTAYHASFSQYDIGSIIRAKERPTSGLQAQVEKLLTQHQPHDMISRTKGLFVAHSAAHAKIYLKAEPLGRFSNITLRAGGSQGAAFEGSENTRIGPYCPAI